MRAGNESDLEWTAELDHYVRGARRVEELRLCLREDDQFLVVPGQGYALLRRSRVATLVALDEHTATRLLTAGLAQAPDDAPAEVTRILADQQWAVKVTLAAGLEVHPHGPVMLRGWSPPSAPYLPDGALG